MTKKTKRFYVEELHKNDNTLSKTKLFKMKIAELETMFNNVNLTASSSDNYSRATFDDISEDEKEEQEVTPQPIPDPVSQSVPEPDPEPDPQPDQQVKQKFNRRELKKMLLDPFNREVTELIKDLEDGNINDELAVNEFNIIYEEYLQSVEHYTRDMEMTDRDVEYVDNFFALQEKRVFE